ncbi:hypothetical protein D3C86_2043540 [compost metagenome]
MDRDQLRVAEHRRTDDFPYRLRDDRQTGATALSGRHDGLLDDGHRRCFGAGRLCLRPDAGKQRQYPVAN